MLQFILSLSYIVCPILDPVLKYVDRGFKSLFKRCLKEASFISSERKVHARTVEGKKKL